MGEEGSYQTAGKQFAESKPKHTDVFLEPICFLPAYAFSCLTAHIAGTWDPKILLTSVPS